MKTIAFLCLCFLAMGCATAHPTLEDLMRGSYEHGCVESQAHTELTNQNINPKDSSQSATLVQFCQDAARSFKPEEVQTYDPSMRLYYSKPVQREVR